MTAISFTRAVQMSTSTLNLRPVILLPPGSSNPGELTCVSPQALRGPDHAEWQGAGRSQKYSVQLAIVARQQEAFKHAWKLHYTRRLRRRHNMAEENIQFSVNDTVLITDLSAADGQNPFPRMGVIKSFMDSGEGQAVIRYGGAGNMARSCNRLLSKLVLLVEKKQTVPKEGLLWDPLIKEDLMAADDEEAQPVAVGDGGDADEESQHVAVGDGGEVDAQVDVIGNVDFGQEEGEEENVDGNIVQVKENKGSVRGGGQVLAVLPVPQVGGLPAAAGGAGGLPGTWQGEPRRQESVRGSGLDLPVLHELLVGVLPVTAGDTGGQLGPGQEENRRQRKRAQSVRFWHRKS